MKINFNIITMATLVKGVTYPVQTDFLDRETKTQIILKNGLKFRKKDGCLVKNKQNVNILSSYAKELNFQTLMGFNAIITKESLKLIND